MASLIEASNRIPGAHAKRKRFDPHRAVSKIVIYGLALDGAVRFLHWLVLSLAYEFGRH